MQTPRASTRIRWVAVLLALFLGLSMASPVTAHAAEDIPSADKLNADQMKRLAALPEPERNKIRDQINLEHGKQSCANPTFYGFMGGDNCENIAASAFGNFLTTPEAALDYAGSDSARFCTALVKVQAPTPAVSMCLAGAVWKKFSPVAGAVLRTALSTTSGGQAVLGAVDTVAFIADAKDGFEKFANTVKDEGVKTTNEVLNTLLKVSTFEVDDGFRDVWAAFAGIGILIMALMYFKLWKDVSNGDLALDSARQSLFWYGPFSVLLVLFGPALGYVINDWLTSLVLGAGSWASVRVTDFLVAIMRFASYESSGVFGPLAGVVLFGLLFVGAWALLGLFALQPVALYLLGVGLALMVGFMVHPQYRPRVGKTSSLWLGIALSKPLLLLIMGAVFKFLDSRPAFAEDGVDDAMVNATSVFLAGATMLVLACSPGLLFKYVPLLPASASNLGTHRQSVVGAAMMAGAGAAISSAIRRRRTAQVQSGPGGRPAHGTGPVHSQQPGVHGPTADQGTGGTGRGLTTGRRNTTGRGPDATDIPVETRTLSELQRAGRSGTAGAGPGFMAGAGSMGRGSAKIAAGGATAFLLAGRETARQAALRGQRAVHSMVPDTDHISGR